MLFVFLLIIEKEAINSEWFSNIAAQWSTIDSVSWSELLKASFQELAHVTHISQRNVGALHTGSSPSEDHEHITVSEKKLV